MLKVNKTCQTSRVLTKLKTSLTPRKKKRNSNSLFNSELYIGRAF